MLTPMLQDYGLGFGVNTESGTRSFGHGGSNEGFRCQLHGHRDRPTGAVVMTNAEQGGRLTGDLLRAIASEYGWPDMQGREVTLVEVPVDTLRSYEGRYQLGGETGEVTINDGRLTMRIAGGPAIALDPIGHDTFVQLENRLPELTFTRNARGELQLSGGGITAVRQEKRAP
jgi:hypothetical protein